MRELKWVSTLMILAACIGVTIFSGCNTVGFQPDAPENQKAFEGVSIAMGLYYFTDVRDSELGMSDIVKELVAYGDTWLSNTYPQRGWTYLGLVRELSNQITGGKFQPDVMLIYGIVTTALDQFGGEARDLTVLEQNALVADIGKLENRMATRQSLQDLQR